MPELRWILIVCGALLLLGIYLWGRRSARQAPTGEDTMLRIHPEAAREPHSAFVFREEPSADFNEVRQDESLRAADDEPISAVRDHRRGEASFTADPELDSVGGVADEPVPLPQPTRDREMRRTRIEPTLGAAGIADHDAPQPLPAHEHGATPDVSTSSTPPRRTERRKIIALRIAAGPQRFGGEQLLEAVEAEGLQHGKYDVFHRLDDAGVSVFSVASMVEPGTFDLERMHGESFPGITLFTQFPGPYASMLAFNELVLSARRLQEKLGGTLQDERGVPLTMHRLERLRQDIREFEQGQGRDGGQRADLAPSATH
jgi:cell division protein ZipA